MSTPSPDSPVPGVFTAGWHERLEWRLQRVGWLCWAILLGAAFVGLLGSGPLNQRSTTSESGTAEITYGRVVHHHHRIELRVNVQSEASEFQLRLPNAWLNSVTVKTISPEPIGMSTDRHGAIWTFSAGGRGKQTVRVLFEYEEFGEHETVIAFDSGELLVRQFVLP